MDSRGATAGQPHLENRKGTSLLLEPGKISSGIPGESGNSDGQQRGGASHSAVLRWKEELEINRHDSWCRSQCHHLQHRGDLQTQQSEHLLLHFASADRDSETHGRYESGFPGGPAPMVGEASGRMQKADCRDEIALPAAMLV